MNELLEQLIPVVTKVFLFGGTAFIIAMILTPVYTYFAYKYKFWKDIGFTLSDWDFSEISINPNHPKLKGLGGQE